MFDNLEALFIEGALQAYRDFTKSITSNTAGRSMDLRLAVNAANALYHFREHVSPGYHKSRTALAATCPDYELLGDLANASKHGTLTQGTPRIVSATDLREEILLTEYQDAAGSYYHTDKSVVATLIDGSTRDVWEILRNVLNMWIHELHAMGLLLRMTPVAAPTFSIPARRTASGASNLSLVAETGLRMKLRYQIQKYNHATGQIEAVDITAANFVFEIKKPPS